MTLRLCELTIDDLRAMRKHLLRRYVETAPDDPKHKEIGIKCDLVSLELVRRTGDKKYKL